MSGRAALYSLRNTTLERKNNRQAASSFAACLGPAVTDGLANQAWIFISSSCPPINQRNPIIDWAHSTIHGHGKQRPQCLDISKILFISCFSALSLIHTFSVQIPFVFDLFLKKFYLHNNIIIVGFFSRSIPCHSLFSTFLSFHDMPPAFRKSDF